MSARFFNVTIATGQRGIGSSIGSSQSLSVLSRSTDAGRAVTYCPDETIVVRNKTENVEIVNSGGGSPASGKCILHRSAWRRVPPVS